MKGSPDVSVAAMAIRLMCVDLCAVKMVNEMVGIGKMGKKIK